MFRDFKDIEKYMIDNNIRASVVVGGSHDDLALPAIVRAKKEGIIEPILIGDAVKTEDLLRTLGEEPADYRIEDEKNEFKTARKMVKMVLEGKAEVTMKGLMQSSSYLMAIRNPLGGLVKADSLMNQVTVFYDPSQEKLVYVGDCAVNAFPTVEQRCEILRQIISLVELLGNDEPKIALLSAIEKPSPMIPSSVEAATMATMNWGKVIVEGPMALDNALDASAARHKGMDSKVAGQADILLVPDIHAGNILHKAIHFFGHLPFGTLLLGDGFSAIFNSRTDDEDAKYYSILLGVLCNAERRRKGL
ncbi:MAG: hypothetical protein J6K75_07755 [Erysipelotrichaceae bacterium]|nr:hypothetical protein [Erysipelotrichaceae bacterium]